MTIYEAAKKVTEAHQCANIRQSAEDKTHYDFAFYGENPKGTKGWVLLDAVTARAIVVIYDALKEPRLKMAFLGLPLEKLVIVVWKLVK